MKIHALLAALALAAPIAVAAPQIAAAQEDVDVRSFYEALEPHGNWIRHPHHGHVWSPEVARDWRPYTRGHWVWTDEHGWYWESDEPWGWATYHYGRWFLDDDNGWLWMPGSEWGPAWVAWRHSDEAVGWAPLPPEAEWRGDGLSFTERYYDTPRFSSAWTFVPVAALTSYSIYRYLLPPHRNQAFLRSTTWVPRPQIQGRYGVYNAGIDRRRYEALTRRPIAPTRIVPTDRPYAHQGGHYRGDRGSVQVYRPRISGSAIAVPPSNVAPESFRRGGFGQPSRDGYRGGPGVPPQPGSYRPPSPQQASPPPYSGPKGPGGAPHQGPRQGAPQGGPPQGAPPHQAVQPAPQGGGGPRGVVPQHGAGRGPAGPAAGGAPQAGQPPRRGAPPPTSAPRAPQPPPPAQVESPLSTN